LKGKKKKTLATFVDCIRERKKTKSGGHCERVREYTRTPQASVKRKGRICELSAKSVFSPVFGDTNMVGLAPLDELVPSSIWLVGLRFRSLEH
jgi:hypothetical protein